ncbi:MAG: helix-turn-helix transcriptional regulator [Gammaproteobacteria bacterium]|nr:helix-turn-helix transcriptional regulator [Gammaproteobacteria bacterium]
MTPRTQSNCLVDYINENIAEDITLESLSSLTHYSSYHFAHLFKKSFGIAPHQYLIKCRIEKAKQLLKDTNMNIAQITLEIGYENQSHFTKLFKQMVGVTPGAYRSRI